MEKDAEQRRVEGEGRYKYVAGSYGGPGKGYLPSIMCHRELEPDRWAEEYCLVKEGIHFEDEPAAKVVSGQDLEQANLVHANEAGAHEFAASLVHRGYRRVTDFRPGSDNRS
jgi:hypothetical protein